VKLSSGCRTQTGREPHVNYHAPHAERQNRRRGGKPGSPDPSPGGHADPRRARRGMERPEHPRTVRGPETTARIYPTTGRHQLRRYGRRHTTETGRGTSRSDPASEAVRRSPNTNPRPRAGGWNQNRDRVSRDRKTEDAIRKPPMQSGGLAPKRMHPEGNLRGSQFPGHRQRAGLAARGDPDSDIPSGTGEANERRSCCGTGGEFSTQR
jgi:hypothetical protein